MIRDSLVARDVKRMAVAADLGFLAYRLSMVEDNAAPLSGGWQTEARPALFGNGSTVSDEILPGVSDGNARLLSRSA